LSFRSHALEHIRCDRVRKSELLDAEEFNFDAPILLDEKEARKIAKEKGLVVIGTVGLIERAAARNLVDLRKTLTALQKTNMRVSRSLIHDALMRQSQKRTKPVWPDSPAE